MNSHDSSIEPPRRPDFDGLLPDRPVSGLPDAHSQAATQRVDQVAIRKLGGFNFLEPTQWIELAREERMKLIKNGAVIFLFQGEEVPARAALLYLQAMSSPQRAPAPRPIPGTEPIGFDLGRARPGEV